MSYLSMLTHKCDIYHLKLKKGTPLYGVPNKDMQRETYYGHTPDVSDQPCYIVEKSQTIAQNGPNRVMVQNFLGHFPFATDMKINSKVVWDGIELKAQMPKNIKNHHREVTLTREVNL